MKVKENREKLITWIAKKGNDPLQTPLWLDFHKNAEILLKVLSPRDRDANSYALCSNYHSIAYELAHGDLKEESRKVCFAWMSLCDSVYGNQPLSDGNFSMAAKLWSDIVTTNLNMQREEIEKELSEKKCLEKVEKRIKYVLEADWVPNNLRQVNNLMGWFRNINHYIIDSKILKISSNSNIL